MLLSGVLVAGPAAHRTPQQPSPAPLGSSTAPAALLAAAGSAEDESAGDAGDRGSDSGERAADVTAPRSSAPSAGNSASGATPSSRTGVGSTNAAALSHAAAGLVDIETITDKAQLLGTGMVLRSDGGLVLTNHHVIDHARQVRVRDVGDRHVYRASVVAADSAHDLALLRLQDAANLTVVAFGDSRGVKVGDPVTALGNAGGGNGNPIAATGTVTALGQAVDAQGDDGTTEHLTGMIQANAPAAPGDSGGPMLDRAGVIIGVTTAGSDNSTGAGQGTTVTGKADSSTQPAVVDATPINVARAWITQVTTAQADSAGTGAVGGAVDTPGSSAAPSDTAAATDR